MASQPPLLLLDNFFDRVQLYPAASLHATTEAIGREKWYAVDYRRDRTWWQTTSGPSSALRVDLGASTTPQAATYCFLDRGHNLWGQSVAIESSPDDAAWTVVVNRTVPALVGTSYVPGGAPGTTWTVTEEGACYMTFPASTARRYWRVHFSAGGTGGAPVVLTGVQLGVATQLASYSRIFDPDARERGERTELSTMRYGATDRTYANRVLELSLGQIGATVYDAQLRSVMARLFELNQPVVIAMNHGDYPERAWMYRMTGSRWSMPTERVYRAGRFTFAEWYPRLY